MMVLHRALRIRLLAALQTLRRQEDGAATVLSLYVMAGCILVAGFAIDTSNIWRHREVLQLSADVAAHAGAVALAQGMDATDAAKTTVDAVQWNTPEDAYGRIIDDPNRDIEVLHYDVATGALSKDGVANAVRVRLQRSQKVDNPVPTFLYKFIGLDSLNIAASSVAILTPTQLCSNSEGVFANGDVVIAAPAKFGADYCLHSQTAFDIQERATFDEGSSVSLPDMAACAGNCGETRNPGIEEARTSVNLLLPETALHIARLAEGFADQNVTLPEEVGFFATRPIGPSLSALQEMMIETESLRTGSLVVLTPIEFNKMREFPSGLVYSVTCAPVANSADAEAEATLVVQSLGQPKILKDMALITNCALWFDPATVIEGSLILSTLAEDRPSIEAERGAIAGDRTRNCSPATQSVLMSAGPVKLPAEFLASNVALVVAGDVVLGAGAAAPATRHMGTTIHAGGTVTLAGEHNFTSCGQPSNALLPSLELIRYVVPVLPGTSKPKPAVLPVPKADMPGEQPEDLERAPALIGSADDRLERARLSRS